MISDPSNLDFNWIMEIPSQLLSWYEAFIWGNYNGPYKYFLEYIYLFLIFCVLITILYLIRRVFR